MIVKVFLLLTICSILNITTVTTSTAKCDYYSFSMQSLNCDLKFIDPSDTSILTDIATKPILGRNDSGIFGVIISKEVRVANIFDFVCEKFENLKEFNIEKIALDEIVENSFMKCQKLNELFLHSHNSSGITTLPEGLFTENRNLTKLDVSLKELRTIPENLFAHQEKLKTLRLVDSNIKSLPANIFKPLINLEALVLSSNKIVQINPEWFATLGNLEELYLGYNKIVKIPKNTFVSLKKLQDLGIEYNQIKVIHFDSFGQLPNLKILNLWSNKIEAVDEQLIENFSFNKFSFAGNICADHIYSYSKNDLKKDLKKCFENYRARNEFDDSDDEDSTASLSIADIEIPEQNASKIDKILNILNKIKSQNRKILNLVERC